MRYIYFLISVVVSVVVPDQNTTPTNITVINDIEYSAADYINLGKVATGAVTTEIYYLKDELNQEYFIITYRDGQSAIVKFGDTNATVVETGFQKPWKPVYLRSSRSIMFVSSIEPKFCRVALDDGEILFSGTVSNTTSGFQERCVGTDGNFYFGTQLDGRVYKYNVTTDAVTEFPQLSHVDGLVTYVYWVGADSNYIYSILRRSGSYILSILNQTTLVKTEVGTFADAYKSGNLVLYQDAATSEKFWNVIIGSSATQPTINQKYKDGALVSLNQNISLLQTEQFGWFSYYNEPGNFISLYSIDADLEGITGLSGDAYIDYKHVGEPSYDRTIIQDIDKDDFSISTMFCDASNNLIGLYGAYGPVFKWNTTTDAVSQIHPYPNVSGYSIDEVGSLVYLGGYPNNVSEWNPSNSWVPDTNPIKVPTNVANAYYPYFMASHGDWLYICQKIDRNDYGISISAFNTVTKQVINSGAPLTAFLKEYDISHFTVVGDNLVLITDAVKQKYPLIISWDLSATHNLNDITLKTKTIRNLDNSYGGYGLDVDGDLLGISKNILWKYKFTDNSIEYRIMPGSLELSRNFWVSQIGQVKDGRVFMNLFHPADNAVYMYEVDGLTLRKKTSNLGVRAIAERILIGTDNEVYLYGGYSNGSVSADGNGVRSYTYLEKLILD